MKKIKLSLLALTVVSASTFSFTSNSEPGIRQQYMCSIHHDMPAIRHGGGMTDNTSFSACVANVRNSPHFAEVAKDYQDGKITLYEKELHIPENCATLEPFD
ncbi:hypothetical protein ACFODZ_01330 [Marinicella sediminis]|uniref:Cytochrome c n=1 Tax=Marinicella sediminis TaxID=1792834 RepID=A0ABV7J3Z8_9GAMM|nr:hypothetical protein [Marinicella sediminis]